MVVFELFPVTFSFI